MIPTSYIKTRSHWIVLILTVTLAACSMLYELLIAQTMSHLSANTVVWYSVTIGLFLLGMGIGSLFSTLLRSRVNTWKFLVLAELLLTLTGGLIVASIHAGHMLYLFGLTWGLQLSGIMIFFGITSLLTLWIGLLTGIELPLLITLGEDLVPEVPGHITLGTDYIGSLVGAFLFPLFFVPNFELLTVGLMVASANIFCVILLIFDRANSTLQRTLWTTPALCLVACLVYGASIRAPMNQYFLKKYYYYMTASEELASLFDSMPDMPDVYRVSSPYQKIDLIEDPARDISHTLMHAFSNKRKEIKGIPENNILFLNGDFQINTSFEEIYHEFFAHTPILLNGKTPKDVLVLGGGDGILIKELLKYPDIEITHIDLDKALIDLARTHPVLKSVNQGSFDNPRVHTEINDGYYFMRHTDKTWDAIYIDFPSAVDYNLAKLYSREFFAFVKKRIRPDGFAVFDSTGTGALLPPDEYGKQEVDMELNDWPVYYHTLKAAGFDTIKPYVTTLDPRNDDALAMLSADKQALLQSSELWPIILSARNSQEAAVVENVLFRSLVQNILWNHVISLQQGFIVMAHNDEALSGSFRTLPFTPHVLTKDNFKLSTSIHFPHPDEIDYKKVNSIFRPTFPTIPFWQPRSAF